MKNKCLLLVVGFGLLASPIVYADHGPGTSGGGTSTQSGETLKAGKFSVDFRFDYTQFDDLSDASIQNSAVKAGSIDLLDRSFVETVSVAYGIVENFQMGLSIGYYQAKNAREVEFDPSSGSFDTETFNPDGLTDLWLSGKYRFYRGPLGQFAVFGGMKFPTGRDNVMNSGGVSVEPSATAGSGSYDGMLGLAYSRWLTSRLTLDSSAQYTLRTEHNDFKVGDRFDGGVAVAYRFTEDVQHYPQFGVFGELNVRHLLKSEDAGVKDDNTGGTVLFLSPGFRAGFCKNATFTVSPQIPILQELNGEQLKTDFKLIANFTLTF